MSEWDDHRDAGWELIPPRAARDKALRRINRNIIRLGRVMQRIERNTQHMATAEQVAALTTAIDELETATETEIGQINARIDELIAAAGDESDPNLDAQIARLQAQRDRIASIIPDAPPV